MHIHVHPPCPCLFSWHVFQFSVQCIAFGIQDSAESNNKEKILARLSRNLVIVREIAYKRCPYWIPFSSLTALNLTCHVDALATAHYRLPPSLPLLLPYFGFGGPKTAASRFLIVRTLA